MYAITIRQPWASLIMAGIKTLETRSRATNIRGRVLIHSGLKFHDEAPVYDSDGYGAWPFINKMLIDKGAFYDHELERYYNNLPLGKILGSVEITDCIPAGDWVEEHCGKGNVDKIQIYEREFALGDLSSNMFCWVLKDPQPWGKPYPCKGQQGFWDAGNFAEIVDLM